MQEGNVMLYARKESGPILDKEATKSIIGYNPMSPRVITIRLKAHPINLTIIQVYAPTSDASDENLESFYNTVQEALDKTTPRDLLVMMGDWNVKVGKRERKNSHIGIHGLGEQNERGVKLAEFCISNDLTIGNTIFPHHPRRLYTWRSPGERTRNQIDYIMVKQRWRTSLLNVKTRPDADCGSDHQLLLATAKIKGKPQPRERMPQDMTYRTTHRLSRSRSETDSHHCYNMQKRSVHQKNYGQKLHPPCQK